MRLESAVYSSREGITAHGQAISVVGDNISNSNTIGFRHSRVEFGDLVAEGGSAKESGSGIATIGNGVAIKQIRPTQETGVIEFTGRSLDLAIEGRGFLMVGDPTNPYYTRAGNLEIGKDGILKNSNGQNVLGFAGAGGTELATLDVNNLNLSGKSTSTGSLFGNLDSSAEITEIPTNPATFTELGNAASFLATMTVYDSLGAGHDLSVYFFKTAPGSWTAQAYMDGGEVGGTEGVPVKVGTDATLTYGTDGKIADANKALAVITATPPYSEGAAAGSFIINLDRFTQFAGSTQLSSVAQDGQGSGNITDYEIRKNGEVYANMDTGQSLIIGSLRLADFVNVDGLQRYGNGLYIADPEAGERRLGQPGADGLGTISGASLERSTVDTANQFVDLVLYQRGYQASSQTLNAVSTLIRDTIALIR